MAAGNRIDYESVRQHKNGTLIPVSIVGAPIIISGKKAGIYVIYRNITKRRKSEEALRQSEKEYRSIFENTGTATIIIEETTVISLANSEFEKLSGYTKAEIEEKKRWTDFFVGEDAKKK